jgi:hypothetical protein
MSKFYSDKAPTPVFAVTFVSNRDGIIPKEKVQTSSKSTTPQQNEEDITNPNFKSSDYKEGIEAGEKDLLNKIASIKKTQRNNPTPDEKKRYDEALTDYRKALREFREKNMPTFYGPSNSSTPTIPTKDSEYLIYSNLQIQKTDDPTDLSQQSNWYLREAEVELTRDWPIQKAKLIVTCKLLDNGSIPPLVEVENGFVYEKNNQTQVFTPVTGGRFLSADDEVRIYAGYKNDQCISMNDLDKYPFDFTNLEATKPIPPIVEAQVKFLEKQVVAIQNAIDAINNPLTDPTLYANIGIALLPLGLLLLPAAGPGGAVATIAPASKALSVSGAAISTTGTTGAATTALGFPIGTAATSTATGATSTALSTQVLPRVAASTISTATNAAARLPTTTAGLDALATAAYNKAIASGLGITAASVVAINTVLAGSASAEDIAKLYPDKITTNYLEGRIYLNDNKALIDSLKGEITATNNLIQVLLRKAGVETKTYTANPNKIAPIFWGFIDSVDFISNSNAGVQIIYNLRDRSRILADTKLVTLPFLGTDANNKNTFEGLKHKTVESVYRATNGGIYLDNSYQTASSLAWRSGFNKGEVISLYEDIDKKIIDTKSALAKERLKYTAAIEDPARWVIANAFLSSSNILNKADYNNLDPLFHIWTLQGPLVSGSGNNTMQIINKSPFEILNYLAMTEVMPIDIFTSHINGHFMFAPRILDTTGLYDEQRGNRLYYFFDCFDQLPNQRNLIKDIRVQTSTVGVYNRFTVLTADFGSSTNASLSGLTSIVDIASANTKNRKVPIKQHVIVDPKIKASEGNKEGAAQALALTTASTMARDHTMIIFKIIGDSSFYPGEAVRIFNTVLHSKGIFTFNATSTSSAVFLKSLYDEVQKLLNSAVKQGGDKNKVVDLSAVIDSMRRVAGAPSDDLNDALPMYKVRGITHSLKANGNDAGYTTKIVAVADIL